MFTNPSMQVHKTYIDYTIAENIEDEKLITSLLFTEVSAGKEKYMRILRFDKTKYVKDAFCQTLSDIPWSKSINAKVLMNCSICLSICYQVPWKSMLLSKKCF